MRRLLALVGVLIFGVTCDQHNPAAPTSVALVMTPTTLTVARNATGSLTVQVQRSNGTFENVTAAATWTSSAPDVVTVQAGVVKAVGVGTATVTAAYETLKATAAIVARRNTRLTGAITIEDTKGWSSIDTIDAYLDQRLVYGNGFSGGLPRWTIPLGDFLPIGSDTNVEPGDVRLSVRLIPTTSFEVIWLSTPASYVELRDRDTGEVLERMPLNVQTVVKPPVPGAKGEIVWTLSIGVYH